MTAPLPDAVGVVERLLKGTVWLDTLDMINEAATDNLMSEAATLIQSQAARIAELEARYDTIKHPSNACPNCALTKAECADTIAEIEIGRRQARSLLSEGEG